MEGRLPGQRKVVPPAAALASFSGFGGLPVGPDHHDPEAEKAPGDEDGAGNGSREPPPAIELSDGQSQPGKTHLSAPFR